MRVLLAPIEIAGQIGITARALRTLGIDAVSCNYRYKGSPYGYVCDKDLGPNGQSSRLLRQILQFNFILASVFRYDVFHFNFGKTLIKHSRDIPFLKRLGKKLVMEFWGNDARMDDAGEMAVPRRLVNKDSSKILHKLRRLGQYIDVALVADLELKGYVEPFFRRVELVPQRIELDTYVPRYPDPAKRRPLVAHAPTDRKIKGTEYVLAAVEKLKRNHAFDFSLINPELMNLPLQIWSNVGHTAADQNSFFTAIHQIDAAIHGSKKSNPVSNPARFGNYHCVVPFSFTNNTSLKKVLISSLVSIHK